MGMRSSHSLDSNTYPFMPAEQDWLHLADFEALLDLARKWSARDLEIDVTKNTDHHTCNVSEAAAAYSECV
jgi:hypothetical protein